MVLWFLQNFPRLVPPKVRYLWSDEARRFRPAGVHFASGQEAYKVAKSRWQGYTAWRKPINPIGSCIVVHEVIRRVFTNGLCFIFLLVICRCVMWEGKFAFVRCIFFVGKYFWGLHWVGAWGFLIFLRNIKHHGNFRYPPRNKGLIAGLIKQGKPMGCHKPWS